MFWAGTLWGTAIAIKTLKTEVFENKEEALEELQKEVEILNQLRHPNVVLYMGVCLKQPHVCILTEWCERGSLHDLIHDQEFTMDVYRMVDYESPVFAICLLFILFAQ
jgi:serine/threonine protein kinase